MARLPGSERSRRSASAAGSAQIASSRPATLAAFDDRAGAHRLDAGPVPVPGRDGLPRRGRWNYSHPGRRRTGCRRSVPGQQPAPGSVRLDADDLLLQHRGDQGLQHPRGAADAQARKLLPRSRSRGCAGRNAAGSSRAPSRSGRVSSSQRGAVAPGARRGSVAAARPCASAGSPMAGAVAAACRARPASATSARWRRGRRCGASDRPVRACARGASGAG